ncbi:MAG: hypothetical protein HQK91_01565 [Nitrospirae bacterium]|nr:hypothetical protein [Nitrospirota bacterium]
MKKLTMLVYVIVIILSYAIAASADDVKTTPNNTRVIEETVVLQDPTVAQSNKWLVGISGEVEYTPSNFYTSYKKLNGQFVGNTPATGAVPGGTVYLGYDNWTLSGTYRDGGWNTQSFDLGYSESGHIKLTKTETEGTLRYLFREQKKQPVYLYLLAGYNRIVSGYSEIINTPSPSRVWGSSSRLTNTSTFDMATAGLGILIPVTDNQDLGLRLDGRGLLGQVSGNTFTSNFSGTTYGSVGTLTGYWNIWNGINLQLGGKIQFLYNVNQVGVWGWGSTGGFFAMLGYTYK